MTVKKKTALFIVLYLTSALLTSCHQPALPSENEVTENEGIAIIPRYIDYSPDTDRIDFFIVNDTDTALTFGEYEYLERYDDGTWYTLPYKQDTAWIDLAYSVMPRSSTSNSIHLGSVDAKLGEGRYRIVKEIWGEESFMTAAEFEISDDGASPDRPYNYTPIDELPKDYEPTHRDYVIGHTVTDEIQKTNELLAEAFVRSIRAGISDQLRMVSYTIEGDIIVRDMIYEYIFGTPRITYISDSSRDKFGGTKTVDEPLYFRHIVTDGTNLYLSRYPEYSEKMSVDREHGGECVQLPITGDETLVEYFETYSENYTANIGALFTVWSPNGINNVTVNPKCEFFYNYQPESGGTMGSTEQLHNTLGTALEIIDVEWYGDTKVLFTCTTFDDYIYYFESYDIETRTMLESTASKQGAHFADDGRLAVLD